MGKKSIVPRERGGVKQRANKTQNALKIDSRSHKKSKDNVNSGNNHIINDDGSDRSAAVVKYSQERSKKNTTQCANWNRGRKANAGTHTSGGSVSKAQMGYNKSLATLSDARSLFAVINNTLHDFNLINCATAVQRLAKARDFNKSTNASYNIQPLLHKAAELIESNPNECEARQLSGLLWACGKLGIRNDKLEESVQHAALQHFQEFKPQELSNMLWGLAKVTARRSTLVETLARHIAISLRRDTGTDFRSGWTPQGVSNVVWSIAAFGEWGVRTTSTVTELLPALSDAVAERAQLFNAQECANTLCGFAKLQEYTDITTQCNAGITHLTTRLVTDTQWVVGNAFTCQQITNVTWAAAKLGLGGNAQLTSTLEGACTAVSAQMNPQELSMVLWAFMTLACSNYKVFHTLASSAAQKADTATAQQMATGAHAMAKVGLKNEQMMRVYAARAVGCVSDFEKEPRDVAFLAWAYAKLEVKEHELFKMFSKVAVGQLKCVTTHAGPERLSKNKESADVRTYTPKHLTMLLFAFAVLNIREQLFIDEAVRATECMINDYNPRDLTNTTWSLCELGLTAEHQPQLLALISRAAQDRLSAFNSQELLKFLGAYERMGGKDSELATAVTSKRTIDYDFPTLGNIITLTSETPKDHEGSVRTRVDNNCGGHGRGNTGVTLWEGSHVLAEWLSRVPHPMSSPALRTALQNAWEDSARQASGVPTDQRVAWLGRTGVEIGAGLGLPSIVASKLGVEMVATDGDDDVLRLLRKNMAANGCTDGRVEKLVWGDKQALHKVSAGSNRHPDLILASDVVYGNDPKQWRKLVRTLVALSGPNTLVLLANVQRYPVHHPLAETKFYTESTAKHFTRSEVPISELAPRYQRTGAGSCVIHVLRRKDITADSTKAGVYESGDNRFDKSAKDISKTDDGLESATAVTGSVGAVVVSHGVPLQEISKGYRPGNGSEKITERKRKREYSEKSAEFEDPKITLTDASVANSGTARKKKKKEKRKKEKRKKSLVTPVIHRQADAQSNTIGDSSEEEEFPQIEFDGYVYR